MASVLAPRILSRALHSPLAPLRCLPATRIAGQRRSVATKHPRGFSPPAREDLEELRERVQEFTRREISEEVAAKTDQSNEFPNEVWKKLGEAGFLGITADEDYGGLAMGYQAHCVVLEELSRASGMSMPMNISIDITHNPNCSM